MKWKSYPQYKDSGIDWLGEIPDGWESKRLKFILYEPLKYGANESSEFDDPTCPRYVRITDINDKGYLREEMFKSLPEDIARSYILNEGDLLFARSGATVGKTFLYLKSWGRAAYAGYLIRARLKKSECLPNFAVYFCRSNNYLTWLQSIFIQATIQNVSAEKYANLIFPVPPLYEQEKISKFLDRETSRIDKLIEKKEKQIELLKEKRAALISHAVTKGLDPNVKMKDSGIDWLGEIPEFWEVVKLRRRLKDGSLGIKIGPFGSSLKLEYMQEDGWKVYGQENIITGDFSAGSRYIGDEKYNELNVYSIKAGDILITMMGSSGKCKVFPQNTEPGIMDSHLLKLRVKAKYVNPSFLSLIIDQSLYVSQQLRQAGKGAIMHGLNSSIVKELYIIVPSLKEQDAILSFLRRETGKIDALIEKVEKSIELLKEYRMAILSAAVTGKIDVKGIV